jgi:ketosteroid isomerase-like protein
MITLTGLRPTTAAALLLMAASTAAADRQSDETTVPADVERAIRARLAEIQDAAQALDADQLFSYVAENDKGALVEDGKLFRTRTAALESTKGGFGHLQEISYQFDQQDVSLLSPTVALATGTGITSVTLKNGRAIKRRFAQSVVLVLADGEWKVFHAHRSFPRANRSTGRGDDR